MKGVSERTVYRWVKNGDVDVRELDGKTHIRVENDDGNGSNKETIIAGESSLDVRKGPSEVRKPASTR